MCGRHLSNRGCSWVLQGLLAERAAGRAVGGFNVLDVRGCRRGCFCFCGVIFCCLYNMVRGCGRIDAARGPRSPQATRVQEESSQRSLRTVNSNIRRFHTTSLRAADSSAKAAICCIAANRVRNTKLQRAFAFVFNLQRFGRSVRSCTRYRATSAS